MHDLYHCADTTSTAIQSPPKSQEGDLVMADANQPSHSNSSKDNGSAAIDTENDAFSNYRPNTSNSPNGKESRSYANSEPGSAWATKKFSEEYERAFVQLQDQKWSMGAFPLGSGWLSWYDAKH
jgi:hypothetical protein